MFHLPKSRDLFFTFGKDFPVCANRDCSHFGDTTPTDDPYSTCCIMCGVHQENISYVLGVNK